jgi:hypothetical protein
MLCPAPSSHASSTSRPLWSWTSVHVQPFLSPSQSPLISQALRQVLVAHCVVRLPCLLVQTSPFNNIVWFSSYGPVPNKTLYGLQVRGTAGTSSSWMFCVGCLTLVSAGVCEGMPHVSCLQCTQDLRIKPELVAPGMVRSAKSSKAYEGKMDSCATKVEQGVRHFSVMHLRPACVMQCVGVGVLVLVPAG